ncbi:hypothetical protein I7I51_03841 [Histoplasma capsulatum]|uniref:Uncharacterized protein n=1 Tax=Ajellomyces capsulatus TaxID=5037 RepID=A0A8A1MAM4_AJECA|nr:hypothetical protein I7I51_03841 [Histoplasma capsulatum]
MWERDRARSQVPISRRNGLKQAKPTRRFWYWNGAGNRGYFLDSGADFNPLEPQSLRPGACLIGYEVPSFIVSNELYQKAKWVRGKRPRKEQMPAILPKINGSTLARHMSEDASQDHCCLTERPINPENHG